MQVDPPADDALLPAVEMEPAPTLATRARKLSFTAMSALSLSSSGLAATASEELKDGGGAAASAKVPPLSPVCRICNFRVAHPLCLTRRRSVPSPALVLALCRRRKPRGTTP